MLPPSSGRVLVVLAWGCASEPPPAPPKELPPEVLVPSAEVVLRLAQLPVQVALPASTIGQEVVLRLDGSPMDGAAFVRAWGPRALLIGELDLREVEAGPHQLQVEVGGVSVEQAFTFRRPACALELRVRTEERPTAARVVVWSEGEPVRLLDTVAPKADRSKREAALDSVFLPEGSGRVWLEPGRYTLAATRGLRAGVAVQEVDPCADSPVTLELGEGLPTDRHAADLHVHTGHSPDAWLPDPRRRRSLATSGLDVAVITDHNTLGWTELGGEGAAPTQILGLEHTHAPEGAPLAHLNAFPLAPDAPLPDSAGRSLAGTIDDLRSVTGVRYVQLDHPRGVDLRLRPNAQPVKTPPYTEGTTLMERAMSYSIWSFPGLDRRAPLSSGHNRWLREEEPTTTTTALDVDAVEVLNRSSVARWLEVRADWFYLLNRGVWMVGTGNSDSHDASVELAGLPSNLLRSPTTASLVDALLGGDVVVSTGPLPELSVRPLGSEGPWTLPGGVVQGGELEVRAQLSAAPWVPVEELRLVVDGEVFDRKTVDWPGEPTGPALAVEHRWTVSLPDDGWLLLEAGWPLDGTPEQVAAQPLAWRMAARGYVPIGFSNPVRVDADADGSWAPLP